MPLFRWLRDLLARHDEEDVDETSVDKEQEAAGVSQTPRKITVGVDFGTSSTKVVLQNWTAKQRTPYALDFGIDREGYTRYSRPSLITIKDDRLLFGGDAEYAFSRSADARTVRSGKIQLLDGRTEPRNVALPLSLPDKVRSEGAGELEALVTLFLADTIRIAVREAREVFPGLEVSELAFNLDVPVSGLDKSPVGTKFQRILDVAIQLAPRLAHGLTLSAGVAAWTTELRRVIEDPPEEGERPGELVPEAEATIQGVEAALGSRQSDRYHAIVDIGAGTTDVGWFKLVTRKLEDKLPFFAAATTEIGCNDVDARLADSLVDGDRRDRREVVRRLVGLKPDLVSGEARSVDISGELVTVTPDDLDEAARQTVPEIYEHYSDTFGPAYKKEKNTDRWRRIRTVVVGGGSLIPALREPFREHPRNFGSSVKLVDISTEMDLGSVGASDRPPDATETPFLTAALGLSYPYAVMPEPILPSDLDPLPEESGPTGLYDYEVDY